jgi:hypothetical protein
MSKRQQREKPVTAGRAAIRGHLRQTEYPSAPPIHMLPRNPAKIEVSALAAVCGKQERQRNRASVKPKIAIPASPRAQTDYAGCAIL